MEHVQEVFDASQYGITQPPVLRNIPAAKLYEEALVWEKGTAIAENGGLVVSSGQHTGRRPKDKRIVKSKDNAHEIWWGEVNIPTDDHTFLIKRERALDYLDSRSRIYVVDGYAGWDERYRIKVRAICTRAYHALFIQNLLIQPSLEMTAHEFGTPDFTIFNAGHFPANRYTTGVTSRVGVDLNFERGEMIILGTEYAGEMKKGVFTYMNYLMPKRDVLSMHCSANLGKDGDCTLFFGLSGTGKTTLSHDSQRALIGDDEHCWTDTGVFNIEGGCYAKCINPPKEVLECIKFGTVLENLTYDEHTRVIDYSDESLSSNTRAAYPLSFVPNHEVSGIGGHPNNIIFLTCDAFGVMPPISKLTHAQAMEYYLMGYTAKIPGTESGITEPITTFSPCFGGVFLPLHPTRYAALLKKRISIHNTKVWLINTGWIGGMYGKGTRISLAYTRSMIQAIYNGDLDTVEYICDPYFNLSIPCQCPNVPQDVLFPEQYWTDKDDYKTQAMALAARMKEQVEHI